MLRLTVRNDRSGPVRGFHPWVFSKAFVSIPEGIMPGEPVTLYDQSDNFLASGYFSSYGQISVRLWGQDENEKAGMDFFALRIARARDIRLHYVENETTNAYRLINGESDLLPGLIADKYGDYLVVQFHTRGIERWKDDIIEAFEKTLHPLGIYERSDIAQRHFDSLSPIKGLLRGEVPDIVAIKENGLRFLVDVKEGQKTGFFLDQRDKRSAFKKYACNKNVLNCFCYTGGFSVYALAGGARTVTSVDSSMRALDLARENIALNGFDPSACEFICEDVKKYLRGPGKDFEAIILDPPAFIKDRRKKNEGLAGYKSINEMALRHLLPGGVLLTCSCSAHLSLNDFRYLLSEVGAKAHRAMTILEEYTHGIDHPQLVPFTEGEYLKAIFIRS